MTSCVHIRDRRPATTLVWELDFGWLGRTVDVSVLRGLRFEPQPFWWVYPSRAAADQDLCRAWLTGRKRLRRGCRLLRRNGNWFGNNPIEFPYGW